MLIDLDGQVAEDVLVDLRLALQLGDERRGRVDLEHDVMRLAVLLDAVGEAAKTPGLGLYDLAAIVLDDLGGAFRDRKSTRLNSSHSCATSLPSSACKTKTYQHNITDKTQQ